MSTTNFALIPSKKKQKQKQKQASHWGPRTQCWEERWLCVVLPQPLYVPCQEEQQKASSNQRGNSGAHDDARQERATNRFITARLQTAGSPWSCIWEEENTIAFRFCFFLKKAVVKRMNTTRTQQLRWRGSATRRRGCAG